MPQQAELPFLGRIYCFWFHLTSTEKNIGVVSGKSAIAKDFISITVGLVDRRSERECCRLSYFDEDPSPRGQMMSSLPPKQICSRKGIGREKQTERQTGLYWRACALRWLELYAKFIVKTLLFCSF